MLRAHLWVEHDLNEVLYAMSGSDWSGKVFGRQFDYLEKVRIAAAFGLVSKELFPALQEIGELRNKLAHRLDFRLTTEDQEKFCRHFSAEHLEQMETLFTDTGSAPALTEVETSNVRYLEGLEGRRALTPTFFAALIVLLTKLRAVADELENLKGDP